MTTESRTARTETEQKEIEELQARQAVLMGTTYSSREIRDKSTTTETNIQHGIGAELSVGET